MRDMSVSQNQAASVRDGVKIRCVFVVLLTLTVVKISSYIAQYPVLRTAQSALNFTSMADLFNQIPCQLI